MKNIFSNSLKVINKEKPTIISLRLRFLGLKTHFLFAKTVTTVQWPMISYSKENFFCKKLSVFLKNLRTSVEPVLFSNLSQPLGLNCEPFFLFYWFQIGKWDHCQSDGEGGWRENSRKQSKCKVSKEHTGEDGPLDPNLICLTLQCISIVPDTQ